MGHLSYQLEVLSKVPRSIDLLLMDSAKVDGQRCCFMAFNQNSTYVPSLVRLVQYFLAFRWSI